jgi:histone-lysine N-methyltransferase SETMAR
MLNRIVTGDESLQTAIKACLNPMETCQPSFTPSAGKVMLTVFWDSQGELLARSQKRDDNVNCASYCEVMLKLRDSIRRNRRGQMARGVVLHHDHATLHTARATQERIQELQRALLEHPPYSLDLAPSDFHLFGPALGANVSLMANRLERRCGSG